MDAVAQEVQDPVHVSIGHEVAVIQRVDQNELKSVMTNRPELKSVSVVAGVEVVIVVHQLQDVVLIVVVKVSHRDVLFPEVDLVRLNVRVAI